MCQQSDCYLWPFKLFVDLITEADYVFPVLLAVGRIGGFILESARTPDSPLPPPPYCSLPGQPRGLKPRDNLLERGRGGVCMGA